MGGGYDSGGDRSAAFGAQPSDEDAVELQSGEQTVVQPFQRQVTDADVVEGDPDAESGQVPQVGQNGLVVAGKGRIGDL